MFGGTKRTAGTEGPRGEGWIGLLGLICIGASCVVAGMLGVRLLRIAARTGEALERETSFERLEARGTLRIALQSAGLEPRSVSREQMSVVLRQVLPKELASRGVPDEVAVCSRLESALQAAGIDVGEASESPDAVFARLGG